ncbi:MAG: hypothetical protein E6L05_06030 [Thaumarchaeota archaeon]|nr:MAG: hypothetical protein E6L05_06030 [Nitrososphaerota archaeon]
MWLKVIGITAVFILLGSMVSYELGNYAFAATSNSKSKTTVKSKTDTSMAKMGDMNTKPLTLPLSQAVKLAKPSLPKGAAAHTCPFAIVVPPDTTCHLDKVEGSKCIYHCHLKMAM